MFLNQPDLTQLPLIRYQDADGLFCQLDLRTLLQYGTTRPWSLMPINWHLMATDKEGATHHCRLSDGCLQADWLLTPEADALCLHLTLTSLTETPLTDFYCALRFVLDQRDSCKVVLPHVLYNDNPSAAPERIIPHIGKEPGKGCIVEEHRLPIPGIHAEWQDRQKQRHLTVLAKPSNWSEQEGSAWSLGALYEDSSLDLLLLSGPVEFNGQKDVVYGGQCRPVTAAIGYRTLNPGDTLEKTFYLQVGTPAATGQGFRSLVSLGYRVLQPSACPQHDLDAMITLKKNVLDHRFHECNHSVGYICYGASNTFGDISGRPEYYLYAWTGQALKLAWCDCLLGLKTDETYRLKRGLAVADFFVRGSTTTVPGLRRAYYFHQSDTWGVGGMALTARGKGSDPEKAETIASRMQGEALMELLDILLLLRENQQPVPRHWEKAVQDGCAFLMDPQYQTADGIYPLAWSPAGEVLSQMVNAAGLACVVALARAYRYFQEDRYLDAARQMCQRYFDLHMKTFDRPFARATMDAQCEDKEAGIYFFVAAHELFQITGDPLYRTWAAVAADWILTFVYFWDTGFQPQTICARKGFASTGWPGVSVQNHHLDVFFPTYELYAYGKISRQPHYADLALTIRHALTHGVCTYPGEWGFSVVGEQGEQYFQTHYSQMGGDPDYTRTYVWRGGMHVWNPSWITAQVLQCNLRLKYEHL